MDSLNVRQPHAPRRLSVARLSINDLIARYFWSLDHGDYRSLAGCFAPDATANYGRELLGVAAIVDYLRGVESNWANSTHLGGASQIVFRDQGAAVESTAVAFLAIGGAKPQGMVRVRGLQYRDEVTPVRGGWAFTRRVRTAIWMFDAPAVPVSPSSSETSPEWARSR